MTTASVIWAAVGLILGTLHAISLWRATHRAPRVHTTILRLASVGALFIGAALVGRILPIASGWVCGFPFTAAALYFRGHT